MPKPTLFKSIGIIVLLMAMRTPAAACFTQEQALANAALMSVLQLSATARACDILEEGTAQTSANKYAHMVAALLDKHQTSLKGLIDPLKAGFEQSGEDWDAFVMQARARMAEEVSSTVTIDDCKQSFLVNQNIIIDWEEYHKMIQEISPSANQNIDICN